MRESLTLSVAELNEYVRRTLAGDPMLHGLRLRGELSNFKRHSSGHWYFTLKDSECAINCAMFRQYALGVRFVPRDGQQVVLYGGVGLYPKTGQYQFYAEDMQPDGLGELYLRFEALKARLQKEGLFDPALKKPLPLLPRGVGVITSKTGAVVHDVARVAWRRNPGMPLYLYPVKVQGAGAAEEIAQAIAAMDGLDAIDVLIVGRGGGSMEDLWPFNEECVARAIFACRKPVVSAVGHETDFTIADFTADVRAATPSAAAELAVESRDALLTEVRQCGQRLRRACAQGLDQRETALALLGRRLTRQTPERQCDALGGRLEALRQRMTFLCESQLQQREHTLRELGVRLRSASPEETMRRGYAVVRQGNRTVRSAMQASMDAPLTLHWLDGAVEAQVLGKKEEAPWQ